MTLSSICQVCHGQASKYKCPSCLLKYCSLSCFKTHKGSDDCKPKVDSKTESSGLLQSADKISEDNCHEFGDSEDRVTLETLQNLEKSEEIKGLLRNPHLRQMMTDLTLTSDPGKMMDKCMQEPIFVELADECLKIVDK